MSDETLRRAQPQPRRSDRSGTHNAILKATGQQIAKAGLAGLNMSELVKIARINRSTVYEHFSTRDELISETAQWVSDTLIKAAFGDSSRAPDDDNDDPMIVVEKLADFVMHNPEVGRTWLFEVLDSSLLPNDPFWRRFKSSFEKFARSDLAKPGIDAEAMAVFTLTGIFLWPVWTRAHSRTPEERHHLVKRFSSELLRVLLHGTMKREKFPELSARFLGTQATPSSSEV